MGLISLQRLKYVFILLSLSSCLISVWAELDDRIPEDDFVTNDIKQSPPENGSIFRNFRLKFNIEDAKHYGQVLSQYKDDYYYTVLSGVFALYIL